MGLEEKLRNFAGKFMKNSSQILKYAASYGGATLISYVTGAASAYYSQKNTCSPEIIALLSFTAKTSAFYISNAAIYTILYWKEYAQGRDWRKDMRETIISNAGGTGVTLTGGAAHWGLMRLINLSPVPSFIIGNVIPGAGAAIIKIGRDAMKGMITR